MSAVRAVIGVNLLWCVPGEVGGSEEYLVRQLAGLAELDDDGELPYGVRLFVLRGFAEAHPELVARYPHDVAPLSGRRRSLRVAVESTWLAFHCRRAGVAAVHHGGGTRPVVAIGSTVLTIHDLQYLAYPEYLHPVKRQWLSRVVPRSVERASVVTVPSDYVRGTLVAAFGVSPERVVVVPHGLDPSVGAVPVDEAELRRRYGLGERFLTYPAVTHPHKNHLTLLRAVAALRADHPDLRLVLIGGRGRAEEDVAAETERLGLRDVVVRPGRVPSADRDALVRHAAVVPFPSRYEGFGAPVLEAMHLGSPVVAAATTALPEVLAGAGVLVDPLDVDAWAAALAGLLDDPGERARLVAAGRSRAAELTARRSAAALLGAYRQALA